MTKIELQWKEFSVDLPTLEKELRAAHPKYVGNQAAAALELWFSEEPTAEAKQEIEDMWAAIEADSDIALEYTKQKQLTILKAKVAAATVFSKDLLEQINAENIMMGINADDMVDEVLTVLQPTLQALQAASLTAVIKRMKAIPEAQYDAKYVTADRLLAIANKIEAFLGLPLSTEL